MVVDFRDRWLEDFFIDDRRSRNIPASLEARLFRKLQLLDDARSDSDLRIPPSNHFEKLRGNLAGWHSIRVNDQWRLIFMWSGGKGEASEVYLDKHEYR
ncbi:MAG TPA: type II toxin-antitoxin system RelE/ParE family toxin [Terracidiphilus sp.]|nr:type II toxin-antitoxin system RelE/ParE family toxin [Terracidiphilus sp.]